MQFSLGQTISVTDKHIGKIISTKVGIIDKIDFSGSTPFQIRVKFECGGSGWYMLNMLSSNADS
jgi:hypothetical protein